MRSLGARAPTSAGFGQLSSSVLVALVVLALAAAVGIASSAAGRVSVGVALLAVPALLVFGFVVSRGPLWCVLGVIAAVILGFSKTSLEVGQVDLRVSDLFMLALGVWVIVLRGRYGQRGWIAGRRILALWLLSLGASLYPLVVHGSADVGSIVGWLRLVATFALVWFVPYAIYRRRDIETLLGGIAFIATAEVGIAIAQALSGGDVGARLSGANGPNATGMVAVIVLVLALHGPVPKRPSVRLVMFSIGVVGLLMSRSMGSTAAAVIAVGIYGVQKVSARRSETPRHELVVPTRLLLMLLVGFAIALAVRPGNLPTSSEFRDSTTVHRLVLADAGLQLFQEHPVFGVGWQRATEEIGTPSVLEALHDRFGGRVNPNFIPKVGPTTEVHNAYVQVLAEAGLVGFLLLVAALVVMGHGIASILRTVRSYRELYVAARAAVVLLVVVLVWLNDNTLYGAQPESVLAATLLGILAAVPAIGRAERATRTVDTTA